MCRWFGIDLIVLLLLHYRDNWRRRSHQQTKWKNLTESFQDFEVYVHDLVFPLSIILSINGLVSWFHCVVLGKHLNHFHLVYMWGKKQFSGDLIFFSENILFMQQWIKWIFLSLYYVDIQMWICKETRRYLQLRSWNENILTSFL